MIGGALRVWPPPTPKRLCPRELGQANGGASRPNSVDVAERLNAEASS